MTSTLATVQMQMVTFMAGGPFMPFWSAVMEATEFVEAAGDLSDGDRRWYDEVYDLVYMGGEDPVAPEDVARGIIGAPTLRAQIRARGLETAGAAPA